MHDLLIRLAEGADQRVRRGAHILETDASEPARDVDVLEPLDPDARRIGRNQHLGHSAFAHPGDQQVPSLLARFDRPDRAVDDHVVAVLDDGNRRFAGQLPGRSAKTDRRDRIAGHHLAESRSLQLAFLSRQGQRHHIAIDQRPRRGMPAELIGDKRQIDGAAAADVSAAVLFADKQHRPAEFGSGRPVGRVETGGVVAILAKHAQGRAVIQEARGRIPEQLLIRCKLVPHVTMKFLSSHIEAAL